MPEQEQFEELTIDGIHDAMRAGELTARALVEGYQARIQALDVEGPALNSIITVSDVALEEADRLDAAFAKTGELTGPLHGIPVLVKDNVETADMVTTFGNVGVGDYRPERDATTVARLRDAGAIILAKTTLPDFATSWFSFSSVSNETKNPYDTNRDPGGSSSGTASSVAANLGTVGIGTDCGGSIRLPSSFCGLVGVRSTPGIVSRHGTGVLVEAQDTNGPMTRTVRDAAIVMDQIVGYDPEDPFTVAYEIGDQPESYAALLEDDALAGKSIGLVTNALGDDDDLERAAVNAVIRRATEALGTAGAKVVEVEIPDLLEHIETTSMYVDRSKYDTDRFLQERPSIPVQSLREVYDGNLYHPKLDLIDAVVEGPDDPEEELDYLKRYAARAVFTRVVLNLLASNNLDALVFPTAQVVAPTLAGRDDWTTLTFPTNTLISSQTWVPAITVPAGLTEGGMPVGLEFLAQPHAEAKLFRFAYAFEQAAKCRKAPSLKP